MPMVFWPKVAQQPGHTVVTTHEIFTFTIYFFHVVCDNPQKSSFVPVSSFQIIFSLSPSPFLNNPRKKTDNMVLIKLAFPSLSLSFYFFARKKDKKYHFISVLFISARGS